MRSVSADVEAILAAAPKFKTRLSVKDLGGTFRDLTTYSGRNMLKSVTWREDVDSPGITWEATVLREAALLSFAPLMQSSGINRGFDIANDYSPLLWPGRQMKVEYAIQAEDDPQAPSWKLAFTGYLDNNGWAQGDDLAISGRGEQKPLVDTFIRRERIYALATGAYADRGVYIFTRTTTCVVGQRFCPTNANLNGHFYRVTAITTGITASSEPVWPTGGGSTVVSGGVTFTESGVTTVDTGTDVEAVMQQLLNDNLGIGVVTLYCPVSPAWEVKWFMVGKQSLWAELRALADQIGWALRHLFDAGSNSMRLTLYDPSRANTTSARTFPASRTKVKRVQVDIMDIRSSGQVTYSDSQDLDPSGFPKRKTVYVENADSLAEYGDRWFEIQEDSASNIDTEAEALVLANAVLDDLRQPDADFETDVLFFPFAEITDLYTLGANGVHFDSDQKLAIVGYEHTSKAEAATTTLRQRGRPSTGKTVWLQRCTDSYNGETHATTALDTSVPMATQLGAPVGGASGVFAWAGGKGNRQTQFELHVSTVNGFTPDSTTIKTISGEHSFNVGDLDPGQVYYGRHVPLTFNGARIIRGEPGAQFTINPGRALATHLNPNVDWGRFPLNGGFETSFDAALPPDFWFCDSGFSGLLGTWGVNAFLVTSSAALQGNNYIRMVTTGTTHGSNLYSAEFSINSLQSAVLSFWRKTIAGGANPVAVGIAWYDYTHAYLSQDEETFLLSSSVGSWIEHRTASITPPANARFARMIMRIDATGTAGAECHFDSVEFLPATSTTTAPSSPIIQTLTVTQPDFPYTPQTLTVPAGTVEGVKVIKTTPAAMGEIIYAAIDVSQWSQSGTTLTFRFIAGLTVGATYALDLEITYA